MAEPAAGAAPGESSPRPQALGAATSAGSSSRREERDAQAAAARAEVADHDKRMASTDGALKGPLDLERVRVKLEVARARVGGPFADIPVGRVYDSPDGVPLDTVAPKAPTTSTANAAQRDQDAALALASFCQGGSESASSVGTVSLQKEEASNNGVGQPSMKESAKTLEVDINTGLGVVSPSVAINHEEQSPAEQNSAPMTDSSGGDTVMEDPPEGDASGMKNKDPISQIVSEQDRLAQSGSDAIHASREVKVDPATIDPQMSPRSVANEDAAILREGNESLNTFLVTELQLFTARLLGVDHPSSVVRDHDIAQATSLQLYHAHQRSLRDFDADNSRFDLWKKFLVENNDTSSSVSPAGATPTGARQNPFSFETEGVQWANLLKHTKVSSAMVSKLPVRAPNQLESSPVFMRSVEYYKRGLNAVSLKRGSGENERRSIATFLSHLERNGSAECLHMVVCANADFDSWHEVLRVNDSLRIYPCWGTQGDRRRVIESLSASESRASHVLLMSFDAFVEDIETLYALPVHASVIDLPIANWDEVNAKWSCILSQRCRQRILVCSQDFQIDARRLLHFLFPGLFCSRRKFLAWNYAALDMKQIQSICNVLEAFIVLSEEDAVQQFIEHIAAVTQKSSALELANLGTLQKLAGERPIGRSIRIPFSRSIPKKPHLHLKTVGMLGNALGGTMHNLHDLHSPKLIIKKRRGSDGGRRARQRITRCGKCAGCLAEDCMVCGHCKDMRKYGGPGLRKQSCKNRKCENPKSWGPVSKRRRRTASGKADGDTDEGDYLTNDDSDVYYDDDLTASYSSIDSDRESMASTYRYSVSGADSDTGISSRYSDVEDLDSPRSVGLKDNLGDPSSSTPRKRIARCGKCAGCTAPDCMKCRNCVDMKKYGGPGHRKQSCKSRTCTAPKSVILNHDKGEYVDESGTIIPSEELESPELSDPSDSTAVVATSEDPEEDRGAYLSVVQECAIFVDPRLVFQCTVCSARFSSKPFFDFHKRIEHPQGPRMIESVTAFDLEASRLFVHPITQNCVIAAQLRQQDRSQRACPLGYAKLEGTNFQYFMIEPYVVLGRLSTRWCELYKQLNLRDLLGLPGGSVDCHLGDDDEIAEQHALVSWDAQRGQFVASCLSVQSTISVDGLEVGFSSPPVPLRSRALIKVGTSAFSFLLSLSDPASVKVPRTSRTPRADVRAWVASAVEKRQAHGQLPSEEA